MCERDCLTLSQVVHNRYFRKIEAKKYKKLLELEMIQNPRIEI